MTLQELQKIKREQGIYALIKDCEIVYIGQSKNVYTRVLEHIVDGKKEFDEISFLCTSETLLLEIVEIFAIAQVKPKYNKLVADFENFYYLLPHSIKSKGTLLKSKERLKAGIDDVLEQLCLNDSTDLFLEDILTVSVEKHMGEYL